MTNVLCVIEKCDPNRLYQIVRVNNYIHWSNLYRHSYLKSSTRRVSISFWLQANFSNIYVNAVCVYLYVHNVSAVLIWRVRKDDIDVNVPFSILLFLYKIRTSFQTSVLTVTDYIRPYRKSPIQDGSSSYHFPLCFVCFWNLLYFSKIIYGVLSSLFTVI